jgi:hypothetical protein
VEDTGGKMDGRHLDFCMPSQPEAKTFGRQQLKMLVLKYSDNEAAPADPQQAAVARSVNRNGRGNAEKVPAR